MVVEVEWPGLWRAVEAAEWRDFVWEFVGQTPGDVWVVVNEVIEEVNAISDPLDGPGGVASGPASQTFIGVSAQFMPVGYHDDLRFWFEEAARRLSARGAVGRLCAGRPDPRPEGLHREELYPLSLIVGLTVSDGFVANTAGRWAPPLAWGPEESVAQRVVEMATRWLAPQGGRVFVQRGDVVEEVGGGVDLGAVLLRSTQRDFITYAWWTTHDGAHARTVSLGGAGLVTAKMFGPHREEFGDVDVLVELARALAPDSDVASVRRLPVWETGWGQMANFPPAPVHDRSVAKYEQRPLVRATHVLDAYVAQVLTEQHLEALEASSGWRISDWEIEALPNNRVLVVACHPEQWIGGIMPTDAALA